MRKNKINDKHHQHQANQDSVCQSKIDQSDIVQSDQGQFDIDQSSIHHSSYINQHYIGIDVGSTTVKLVVVNPDKEIIWSQYQRHETRQPEKVLEMLRQVRAELPVEQLRNARIVMTGSGATPIAPTLNARFVQEVNAVTLAVEQCHPQAGSVIELGGQDAKIIIFKEIQESGNKQAITSMNDKCASGTGATIDKCFIKVGMPSEETSQIHFDPTKLHHVAAKCGVFAETDIVNLVKSGVPKNEIMCSLADAIVQQNISVLTRGNTLRSQVILLGGPNTYLPFCRTVGAIVSLKHGMSGVIITIKIRLSMN
jgi:activator of 2-hydroxyglutaryl-CoA dehydratase